MQPDDCLWISKTKRISLCLLATVLFPAFALAQSAKPAPLAEYISFCLALWNADPDVEARAHALELQDVSGSAGATITVGKTAIRFYKSAQGNQTVGATSTVFDDGKDSSCDISLPVGVERADLEAMERAIDLDGQIVTFGPATIGRWKIRGRQPAILLKAVVGKSTTVLTLQTFKAASDPGHTDSLKP
jgi:hypothetical protein